MRMHQIAFVAVLSIAVPAALSAQTTTGTNGRSGTSTQTTTTSTTTSTSNSGWRGGSSHWIASGFVGSNFNNNSDSLFGATTASNTTTSGNSVDFGGQVGYLWHNVVGAEFLAGFTPNFQMTNAFIPNGSTPWVNTYMVNAVGAAPLGSSGQFQPFISGGFGAVTMRGLNGNSNIANAGSTSTAISNLGNNLFNPDESRIGADIGGGLMAFMGNVGVRGDVRYFRALTNSSATLSNNSTTPTDILPGLNFWRANIGVAFRW